MRITGACLLALLILPVGPVGAQRSSPSLPDALEQYLAAEVRLSDAERKRLLAGEPLTRLLPSDPRKEVFVFGAIWIDASPADYVRLVKNIEDLEKGGPFRITKRISAPAVAADFAPLTLPAGDVKDLRRCVPGDCDVKLGTHGLEMFRTQVRWGTAAETADANAVFRRFALDYVNGYRAGGNARLAVYRDADEPIAVADEFRAMIARAPSLVSMPDLQTYLLDYPSASLTGSTEFLYWQEAHVGLKPIIRINHLIIQDRPDRTVVVSKMLYASHYFWAALQQRDLFVDPARGPGFWFVTVSRSRSDGLTGFIGRLLRGRVRSEAEKGVERALKSTKARLERK